MASDTITVIVLIVRGGTYGLALGVVHLLDEEHDLKEREYSNHRDIVERLPRDHCKDVRLACDLRHAIRVDKLRARDRRNVR